MDQMVEHLSQLEATEVDVYILKTTEVDVYILKTMELQKL